MLERKSKHENGGMTVEQVWMDTKGAARSKYVPQIRSWNGVNITVEAFDQLSVQFRAILSFRIQYPQNESSCAYH